MHKKRFLMSLLVISVIFSTRVMGYTVTGVYLPEGTWVTFTNEKQNDGNYGRAKCDSVYPPSGTDTYSKIRVRVKDADGDLISEDSYYVLTEGKPTTEIQYKRKVRAGSFVSF